MKTNIHPLEVLGHWVCFYPDLILLGLKVMKNKYHNTESECKIFDYL